ncbi:hypothetical protein D3Y59_03805 [Hymenobacter oligotrophus]|uniref:Uncharacterized protein n=1 Tax=Hymenobacter oligotrophus TaxID=2319843 RepID=A0A3B7QWS8_9BACT|nr:hypothetical protein [Hymenobacter oligotrophus]AYA36264.1 hypothetical protein D3Y59_03805 [Hymenobacter oligotrophus]
MNRASLLHILDNVTGISEAEVRELEQLATAFPYCQTAHLLLAKAAHDRGSMLAGQRLRRAATYAADRELLRLLIETPAASGLGAAGTPPHSAVNEVALTAQGQTVDTIESMEMAASEPVQELPVETLVATADTLAADADVVAEPAATEPAEMPAAATETIANEPAPEADAQPAQALGEPAELPVRELPSAEPAQTPEAEAVTENVIEQPSQESTKEATSLGQQPALVPEPAAAETFAALPTLADAAAAQAAETAPALAAATLGLTPSVPDELPAVAPPIRPPAEAGSSRFEFGLAEAGEQEPVYQLPGANDDEPKTAAVPPLRSDEQLGYAVAAGSRLGYALTLRNAELTHDLPLSESWHPDAVHLAHVAAHRPSVAALPSSLMLIERFLRSQPRIKTATARPPVTAEPQADLSVRSTSAPPSLASESLAKIMAKQGKTARAIEIYEQLMQRQPEKKAYFAAQIDLLNQQTE